MGQSHKLTWTVNGRGSIYETRIGKQCIRLQVHTMHGLPDTTWFVSCHEITVDRIQLEAETADAAKLEGFNYVKDIIESMLAAFSRVSP